MDSLPAAPKLGGGPPYVLVMLLLAAGGAGRARAVATAKAADRAAAVAAEAKAATERREQDSLALVGRVAEAPPMSSPALLELDSAIHAAGFPVGHDDVHYQATVRKIDSAVRLIRRGRAAPALLPAAELLLSGTLPARSADSGRVALALAQLTKVRQQVAADSARKAAAMIRRLRPKPESLAPDGATARCRDGSYSFSGSRRGTCSHHGGVAVWLR